MIEGSKIAHREKAHDGHVTNPKSSKFLQQKTATIATFRIAFYCLEKKFFDFIVLQNFTLLITLLDRV